MKLETIAAPIVNLALTEDLGSGDVTTQAVISDSARARARIFARAEGVVAGLDVVRHAFFRLDPEVVFRTRVKDGMRVADGDVVCTVDGAARAILSAERVALNFLQHLSGVATETARFVEAVKGTGVIVRDTRKTTPVLRLLEKHAVMVGGGQNHRHGLFDMVLLKENHLAATGSIATAVAAARRAAPGLTVEVEVRSLPEAEEAMKAGADWILLDNLTPDALREVVQELGVPGPLELAGTAAATARDVGPAVAGEGAAGVGPPAPAADVGTPAGAPPAPPPALEASGSITLDNVRAYAETGVHAVAVGGITHSAAALDFSLLVDSIHDLA